MRRVLVTGASGLLGGHLLAVLREQGIEHAAVAGLDLSDELVAASVWERAGADVVIHAAAVSAMGACAQDPARAEQVNVGVTTNLARLARASGAKLVHVSTDLVFDGERAPYRESAPTSPISTYGRTKAQAEPVALSAPRAVVARLSLLFGPTRTARVGFFDSQLAALKGMRAITVFSDEWRTPLSLRAAAEALVAIAGSEVEGLIHVAGPERMTRLEMGLRLARFVGAPEELAQPASRESVQTDPREQRPRDVSLDTSLLASRFGGVASRSFEDELARQNVGSS
jgi:dTDP-4-dehydrorhamnose reductase